METGNGSLSPFLLLDSEGQVVLKYIYNAQGFPEMSKASFGGSRAQGFPEPSEVEAWGFACRGEYIKKTQNLHLRMIDVIEINRRTDSIFQKKS